VTQGSQLKNVQMLAEMLRLRAELGGEWMMVATVKHQQEQGIKMPRGEKYRAQRKLSFFYNHSLFLP
jgi:hypothetical protein